MSGAPRALAVIDLGFGDCGKGLVTDFLARRTGAGVVVRFNGGAQAGHNVVAPDGRHHTFAQIGAASFLPQVRTFLSRHVLVHPTALAVEARVLASKGVADPLGRLRISQRARVITPYHQAANRLREMARGGGRHGSCGVGVGETVAHAIAHPDEAIVAGDWRSPDRLGRALARIRDRLRADLAHLPRDAAEWAVFDNAAVIENWVAEVAPLARLVAPDHLLAGWLRETPAVVFEGAQGVLLDETVGFHPFCTWSDCTARNARELLAEAAPGADLRVWGVMRAHAARHGAGPLPSETSELRPRFDHNAENPWQGRVRYGWFDAALARYALAVAGPLDALVATHVDLLADRPRWPVVTAYRGDDEALIDERGQLVPLAAPPHERQTRMAAALGRCEIVTDELPGAASAFLAGLERLLDRQVDAIARGPRAGDVVVR
jgi:adenylosuccinate synthase